MSQNYPALVLGSCCSFESISFSQQQSSNKVNSELPRNNVG